MADSGEISSYLRYLSLQGVASRYGAAAVEEGHEIRERMDRELAVIDAVGYPSYFLIVRDLLQFARAEGIPVGPGRGSVCGSVVAYALQITEVDPLRWGIPFERFLHEDRIAPPDVDIDFCQRRRGEVIAYLREKYGHDRVAQILTFGTMAARSVLRETARLLWIDKAVYGRHATGKQSIGEKWAQMVPEGSGIDQIYLREFLQEPHGQELANAIREVEGKVLYRGRPVGVLDTIMRLEGMKRHGSVHAAGVVISDRPLTERVPLYKRNREADVQTQYEHEDVEHVGLLKLDVLGLRTVTILGDARTYIREALGDSAWDLSDIPLDDPATYGMLCAGDTDGVFQLEGEGITNATRQISPTEFDDIAVLISLYRPGPMEQIPEYSARKRGEKPVDYFSEELRPVFERTQGLLVFQEQVMAIAQQMGGYSPGEADSFRKAIGKKLADLIEAEINRWKERALERGHSRELVDRLATQIAFFGRYGFNQAHAYAYAYLTYWTAWVKANYPVAFYTALLNGYIDNSDKSRAILQGARAHKIRLLPPDANRSGRWYSAEEGGIRFGFAAVRGVGDSMVSAILQARDSDYRDEQEREPVVKRRDDGTPYKSWRARPIRVPNLPRPYSDFWDFCKRLPSLPINAKKSLVIAGAFGSGVDERRSLLAGADALNKAAKKGRRLVVMPPPREGPTEAELMAQEREAMGMFVTQHPFDVYSRQLDRYGALVAGRWVNAPEWVTIAGIVARVHTHQSKKGQMAWVTLENDVEGMPDLTIFSDTWARVKGEVAAEKLVVARGQRTWSDKYGPGFRVDSLFEFDRARPQSDRVAIFCPPEALEGLPVGREPCTPGRAPVDLVLPVGDAAVVLRGPCLSVALEEWAIRALENHGALVRLGSYHLLPGWREAGDPWATGEVEGRPWEHPTVEGVSIWADVQPVRVLIRE